MDNARLPSENTEALAQRLRQAQLRPTRARLALLALLARPGQQPLDAEQVYQRLVALDRRVSLGTVYRVLKEMVQRELLARAFDGDGRALHMIWPAQVQARSVRVICRATGQMLSLDGTALRRQLDELLAHHDLALGEEPVLLHISCRPRRKAESKTVPKGAGQAAPRRRRQAEAVDPV